MEVLKSENGDFFVLVGIQEGSQEEVTWAERRVAGGCHEKGSGPRKHAEVGPYGLGVLYIYT